MLRFIQVLMLNAWRGLRRANGTPALIITLVAVCVLFIGSNASARASLQTAMNVVGLPVSFSPDTDSNSDPQSKDSTVAAKDGAKQSDTKHSSNKSDKTASSNDASSQAGTHSNAQVITAAVSLAPTTIAPVCEQGVSLYNVKSAQVTLSELTASAGDFAWNWETRIDSGSSVTTPLNTSIHNQGYDAGVQVEQINSNDPTQPLVSAAASANYSYSFRLDINGPFAANSPWISVPQSTSTTCP